MQVIAEIGSNHKSKDDCAKSIRLAARFGADVVKFQIFGGFDLYGPNYVGDLGLWPDLDLLALEAKYHDIELMVTAFSPNGYEEVNKYVRRHKIASSEITDLDILDRVNRFKKPVIVSTGGATEAEIETALAKLKDCPVTLLYCVVDYPAKIVDFRHMVELSKTYGLPVGYSDHTIDVINIPDLAKKNGATIIEKHVNFCGYTDTPDAGHSLNLEEFGIMVRALKGIPVSMLETYRPNPYKRKRMSFEHFKDGYYRPMPK